MDEKAESTELAIAESGNPEERRVKRSYAMLGVGLSCMLIGAAAVLAIFILSPGVLVDPPKQTVINVPKTVQPAQDLYREPTQLDFPPNTELPATEPNADGQGVLPETPGGSPSGGPAPGGASGPSGRPPSVPPMNPFGGMISTNVPDNWGGTGQVPSGPISTPTNQIEPEKPVEDATLVTARSAGTDAEGDADQIVSALRGIGATVLTAPHYSASGSIVGVQVVAAVPQKSVDSALAKLKGSGVSQTGKWSVSRSERSERVSGMLSSRIQELKAQESTLLEKYHEDATEVVVVREEIQKLNQAIGASRSRPSSNALIIIGVGVL